HHARYRGRELRPDLYRAAVRRRRLRPDRRDRGGTAGRAPRDHHHADRTRRRRQAHQGQARTRKRQLPVRQAAHARRAHHPERHQQAALRHADGDQAGQEQAAGAGEPGGDRRRPQPQPANGAAPGPAVQAQGHHHDHRHSQGAGRAVSGASQERRPPMILVITETKLTAPGKFNPASLEAVAAAQQLGAALQLPVAAVVLGADDAALAGELATRKLAKVVRLQNPALGAYNPDVWVQSLVQAVSQLQPRYVLFPHTYQVRDYAPQLATRMAGALISDVTGFRVENGQPIFLRPMFQGKWAAEVAFTANSAPGFLTVQIGAFRGDQAEAGAAAAPLETLAVTPGPSPLHAGEVFQEAKQAVDLTQAPIIVAVGR